MSDDYSDLVRRARVRYNVRESRSVAAVRTLLSSWGAVELPVERFEAQLFDEWVNEALVVGVFTIADETLIRSRATRNELQDFDDDEGDYEEFDEQSGVEVPDDPEWEAMSDEVERLQRVFLIIERDRTHPELVGNFYGYGAKQWFHEALWAATGVLPREAGPADGFEYQSALTLRRGTAAGQSLPVKSSTVVPQRLWPAYIALMRPWWRRARRRYLRRSDA